MQEKLLYWDVCSCSMCAYWCHYHVNYLDVTIKWFTDSLYWQLYWVLGLRGGFGQCLFFNFFFCLDKINTAGNKLFQHWAILNKRTFSFGLTQRAVSDILPNNKQKRPTTFLLVSKDQGFARPTKQFIFIDTPKNLIKINCRNLWKQNNQNAYFYILVNNMKERQRKKHEC